MRQNIYAVIVFCTLLLAFLCNMPRDSSAWASWMQAFGSVAAILGAVWIARADERRRQVESLAVAEITAVEILGRLGAVHGCVSACIDAMSLPDIPTAEFELRRKDLDELSLPTIEGVQRLVPIGHDVAVNLAQIITVLGSARIILERGGRKGLPPEARQLRAKGVRKLIEEIPNRVTASRKALIRFLKSRGHEVIEDEQD